MRRRWILVFAALTAACRSGDTEPEGEFGSTLELVPAVTASIGPEGGVIEATSAEGVTLSLEFFPGSFERTVALTIQPLSEGDVASFQIDPPGLVPAIPALASVVAGDDRLAGLGFVWEDASGRLPLGGEEDGGILSVELPMIGFRSSGGATNGRSAAPPEEGEGRLVVTGVDCAAALDAVPKEYEKVKATGDADAVGRFLESVQTMKEQCEAIAIAEKVTAICADFAAAVTASQSASVGDDEALAKALGPLMAANAAALMTEGACDTSPFVPAMTATIAKHLDALRARYAASSITDTIETHLDHLDELLRYEANCQVAGIPQSACGPLVDGLYPDVLDALRDATYAECRARANPQPVEALYTDSRDPGALAVRTEKFFRFAHYTNEALEDDVLHCASRVEVSATDDAATLPIALPDQDRVMEGGATPGIHVREASIDVPFDGAFRIAGTVFAPPCPVTDPAEDAIVAWIDNIEVGRAVRAGTTYTLKTTPFDLQVVDLLNAGGVPAEGGSFDVLLSREDSGCPSFATPHLLYTLHVNVGDPLIDAVAVPPTYVQFEDPVSADCIADDETYVNTESAIPESTPLPSVISTGSTSLDMRSEGGRRLVATVSISAVEVIEDECANGDVSTARAFGRADAWIEFVARARITFTHQNTVVPNDLFVFCETLGFIEPGTVIPAGETCTARSEAAAQGGSASGTSLDMIFTAAP